jgi:hypothetical protein
MRDWKVFRPGPTGATAEPQAPLVRKRQSDVDDAAAATDDPQFEIDLDLDAEQLTLLFDDAVKYQQRSHAGTINADVDHQEAWRREALRAKARIGETFGPWSDESHLDGSTYYRKVTRLA